MRTCSPPVHHLPLLAAAAASALLILTPAPRTADAFNPMAYIRRIPPSSTSKTEESSSHPSKLLYRDPDDPNNPGVVGPVPSPVNANEASPPIVGPGADPGAGPASTSSDNLALIDDTGLGFHTNDAAPIAGSGSGTSSSTARDRQEERFHRSMLETRLRLEHEEKQKQRRGFSRGGRTAAAAETTTTTLTAVMTNDLGQARSDLARRVSTIQRRSADVPLLQTNSTAALIASVSPNVTGLLGNATAFDLIGQAVSRAASSVTCLMLAVALLIRAVWGTSRDDEDVRDVFRSASNVMRLEASRLRTAVRLRSGSSAGSVASTARTAASAVGSMVTLSMLSAYAFGIGVLCSTTGCRAVGRLRDSVRDGLAGGCIAITLLVRGAVSLGRGIVSRIRAAQLPVDREERGGHRRHRAEEGRTDPR